MPCIKCPKGLYRIGSGPCRFKSKEACLKAYKAYLAKVSKKLGPADKSED